MHARLSNRLRVLALACSGATVHERRVADGCRTITFSKPFSTGSACRESRREAPAHWHHKRDAQMFMTPWRCRDTDASAVVHSIRLLFSGKDGEESKAPGAAFCSPLPNVIGLHTRAKDTASSIPVQAPSCSISVRSPNGPMLVVHVYSSTLVSSVV